MQQRPSSAAAATSRLTIAQDPVSLGLGSETVAADRPSNTVITAEIPAVPAGPAYGVLLPDGTIWYPGSKRRLPAPLLLRLFVWVLVFATILAGAAVVIIRLHPTWIDPLRRVVPGSSLGFTPPGGSTPTSSAAGIGNRPASSAGRPAAALKLASPQPPGLPAGVSVYDVSEPLFAVQVTASHTTWVADYSLSRTGAGTYPLEQATLDGGGTKQFFAHGPLAVQVGAGLATVKVYAGGKQIGVANHATPWIFWFEPTHSARA